MKKFIFNSSIIVLLFFTLFSSNANVGCANKITCEIQEDKYGGEIFLFENNNDGKKIRCLWVCSFGKENISEENRHFLDQINGYTITEDNIRYNQILSLANNLTALNYSPLMTVVPTQVVELGNTMLETLMSLFK